MTGIFAPSPDPLTEDRKCRICGLADLKNTHIFYGRSKILLTKVLTVYPIIIYVNDPLPKHICKKCVNNVNCMYTDIVRVLRAQQKWISNVRSIQPNHEYIKVLDIIQQSNKVTRESIKSTIDVDLSDQFIDNILLLNRIKLKSKNQKKRSPTRVTQSEAIQTQVFDANFEKNPTLASEEPLEKKQKIKDLKSKLELNGCTLLPVNKKQENDANHQTTTNKKPNNKTDFANTDNEIASTAAFATIKKQQHELIEIKVEPILPEFDENDDDDDDEDNLTLSQIASTIKNPKKYACHYCSLKFQNIKLLAAHQIVHMRLSIPKMYPKKYLHKNIRRGRLITVNGDRKCIRCLNCWQIFLDNKSITDHWILGECEYFCQICGKEFPQTPKMLREHVPAAHGINYRSSKTQSPRLPRRIEQSMESLTMQEQNDFQIYKTLTEQEPSVSQEATEEEHITQQLITNQEITTTTTAANANEISNLTLAKHTEICPICLQVFNSFKARNSHMRKHKPQNQLIAVNENNMKCLIQQREEENTFAPTYKTQTKNANMQVIKVKDLSDLQNKTANDKLTTTITTANVEQLRNSWITLPESTAAAETVKNEIVEIKEEPFDDDDVVAVGTINTITTTTTTTTTENFKFKKKQYERHCMDY